MSELHSPCLYCGEPNSSLAFATTDLFGDKYRLDHCGRCRAYFLDPTPTKQQLDRAYSESYYGEGEQKFQESLIEKMLNFFRMRRAKRLCRQLPPKGRV